MLAGTILPYSVRLMLKGGVILKGKQFTAMKLMPEAAITFRSDMTRCDTGMPRPPGWSHCVVTGIGKGLCEGYDQ